MTADLLDFLRARLDDDQRIAQDAVAKLGADGDVAEWQADAWSVYCGGVGDGTLAGTGRVFSGSWPDNPPTSVSTHIARHDPAHVLREVAAKRAIIDMVNSPPPMTLRWLAAVWSDHPDYRAEWRV